MTPEYINSTVRQQLTIDLNCSADDFDKDGILFFEAKENPGRRPFPRGERHFEMVTMGHAIIVSATADIMPYLKEQLSDKSRDEAFSMPFVYGHGLYYLPDELHALSMPNDIWVSKNLRKAQVLQKKQRNGFVILVGGGDGDTDKALSTAKCLLSHMDAVFADYVVSHNTNTIPARL